MKINAAIAFIFSGISLLLLSNTREGVWRMAGRVSAFLACAIGLVTIAEYACMWDAGIDQLIFKETMVPPGTLFPGRMVLNTAIGFSLLGFALMMIKRRNQWAEKIAQVLALIVGLLGLLALLAFVYGVSDSSGYVIHTRMALNTCISFILLVLGVLCLQRNVGFARVLMSNGSGSFVARRLMPAAIVVPAVLAWLVGLGEHVWYGEQFADVVAAAADMVVLVTLVWVIGRSLNKTDRDREYSAKTLRESEERYRSLVEHLLEGIAMVDRDERFSLVNPAAEAIFGVPPDGLIGRSIAEFVDPDEFSKIQDQSGMRQKGETSRYIIQINRVDGTKRQLFTTASPYYDNDGIFIGALGLFRDVTDQKKAEAELVKFRKALDTSGEAIFLTDEKGIITFVNPGFTAMYGYTAEEIVGKVTPRILKSGTMGVDIYEMFWKTLLSSQEVRGELKNRRKDGTLIDIEGSANAIYDADHRIVGYLGIQRDITERKRAEEALQNERLLLRTLIDNIPDSIYSKDLTSRKTLANAADLQHMGASSESEVIGKNDFDLYPKKIAERFFADDQSVIQTGQPVLNREEYVFDEKGQKRWLLSSKIPLRDRDNKIIGIVGIGRDISDRKIMEQELRSAQKMESLGIVAGGIAHDFNNLLSIMMGNASLAQDQLPVQHAAHKYLERVLFAMERASDLTKQMLAYSGKGMVEIQTLDMADVVQRHIILFNASSSKNVTLETHMPSLPVHVSGDPGQMKQIIMNLIANSSEAIGEKQGTVSVTLSHVTMGTQELIPYTRIMTIPLKPGAYALLTVSDTGSGMDRETMDKIFDPFFTTKFIGRGLGLSAVFGIIQGHKGGITVESAVGIGTTIRVLLPARDLNEQQ